MESFVKAVRDAILHENWTAALIATLVLPDICGWLETPKEQAGKRYQRWAEKWVQPKYSSAPSTIWLSAGDLYALRCAITHNGSTDIATQRARNVLDDFIFVAPMPGIHVHCNVFDSALQLQVDVFCHDMCVSVEEWLAQARLDPNLVQREKKLVSIRTGIFNISV
jgi:hypothetical protein